MTSRASVGRIAGVALALSAAVAAAIGEDGVPVFQLAPREVAYGRRIDYVLGDGRRAFCDEDTWRGTLALHLSASGRIAVLGFRHAIVSAARGEHGEELAVLAAKADGVLPNRTLRTDPALPLLQLALPCATTAYHRIGLLAGTVEVLWADREASAVDLPLAQVAATGGCAIAGIDDGRIEVVERRRPPGPRLVLQVSETAHDAIEGIAFLDRDGHPVKAGEPREEGRERGGRLTYAVDAPDDAVLRIRRYEAVHASVVAFSAADLDLGVVIPGRDTLRGPTTMGANDF